MVLCRIFLYSDEGGTIIHGREPTGEHIIPSSAGAPGFGLNHVANKFLLTMKEQHFFNDDPGRQKLKLACVGQVHVVCFIRLD